MMHSFDTEVSASIHRSGVRGPALLLVVVRMERRMPACLHHTVRILWCLTDVVWSLLTQASSPQSPSLKPFRCDECVWLQADHYPKPLVLVMTFCTWQQESTKMAAAVRLSSLQQIFRLPLELCQRSILFSPFILSCQAII